MRQSVLVRALVAVGLVLASAANAASALRVSPSQTTNTPPDGLTWATAFSEVQPAVDAAALGDEVWTLEGMFTGTVTLKAGVNLCGGFTGTESSRDERDPAAHQTVLDGNGTGSVMVLTSGGPALNTLVDGLILQNGNATLGGGIHCVDAVATFANLVIRGNVAPSQGGGLYCSNATVNLYDCVLITNAVTSGNGGGGIAAWNASLTISNCVFAGNSSYWMGAGVFCRTVGTPEPAPRVVVANSLFRDNSARFGGGVTCEKGSDIELTGNTFAFNHGTAGHGGGGRVLWSVRTDPSQPIRWQRCRRTGLGGAVWRRGNLPRQLCSKYQPVASNHRQRVPWEHGAVESDRRGDCLRHQHERAHREQHLPRKHGPGV